MTTVKCDHCRKEPPLEPDGETYNFYQMTDWPSTRDGRAPWVCGVCLDAVGAMKKYYFDGGSKFFSYSLKSDDEAIDVAKRAGSEIVYVEENVGSMRTVWTIEEGQ